MEGRRGLGEGRGAAHQEQVTPGARQGHTQPLRVAHEGGGPRNARAQDDDVPLPSLAWGGAAAWRAWGRAAQPCRRPPDACRDRPGCGRSQLSSPGRHPPSRPALLPALQSAPRAFRCRVQEPTRRLALYWWARAPGSAPGAREPAPGAREPACPAAGPPAGGEEFPRRDPAARGGTEQRAAAVLEWELGRLPLVHLCLPDSRQGQRRARRMGMGTQRNRHAGHRPHLRPEEADDADGSGRHPVPQQLPHHAADDVSLAAVGHAAPATLAPALAAARVDPQAGGQAWQDWAPLGGAAPVQQPTAIEAAVGDLREEEGGEGRRGVARVLPRLHLIAQMTPRTEPAMVRP